MTGYDMTGYDMTGNDMTGYDMTGYDMTGYDMTWYDMTWWYDMIWNDTVKNDMMQNDTIWDCQIANKKNKKKKPFLRPLAMLTVKKLHGFWVTCYFKIHLDSVTRGLTVWSWCWIILRYDK